MLSSGLGNSIYSVGGFHSPQYGLGPTEHSARESSDKKGVEKADASFDDTPHDSSEEEQKQISALKARDREVKTHEQAHLSAASGIATGGPSFSYQLGPDGVRYAIGGEVQIDTSPVSGDPAATLRKADAIRQAALAPAKPSSQDQSVAAQAAAMAVKAREEMTQENSQQATNPYNGEKGVGLQLDISV